MRASGVGAMKADAEAQKAAATARDFTMISLWKLRVKLGDTETRRGGDGWRARKALRHAKQGDAVTWDGWIASSPFLTSTTPGEYCFRPPECWIL